MPRSVTTDARERAGTPSDNGAGSNDAGAVSIVTLDEFADVEEPGADPLLGAPGEAVIPEGGGRDDLR